MEHEIGSTVAYNGQQFEVTEIKRGWLTLRNEAGELSKARPKDVQAINERNIASTLKKYRQHYKPSTTFSGGRSFNNGDNLAGLLEGLLPEDVAGLADVVLGQEPGFHADKYEHLNAGQLRMNSGNRIRAALRKGTLEFEAVEQARANLKSGQELAEPVG